MTVKAMTVRDIVPTEGLHNSIRIHGDGFIDTSELACHISFDKTDYIHLCCYVYW